VGRINGSEGGEAMDMPVEWLLSGPAWVQYRTRLDLLGQQPTLPEMVAAREVMLAAGEVRALVKELAGWPGPALRRHNDSGHVLHKLSFVAELGLRAEDPGMAEVIAAILSHQSDEGAFQVVANVAERYGGTGEDQLAWMLCDSPLVLSALVRCGLEQDARIQAGTRYLAGLARENGWPCVVSSNLGKFRGPGRKDDPCPYATLLAVKALSQLGDWRDSDACRAGAEGLLGLWERRRERRPYLFAMGTDFAKLKAPFVWYDLAHVLDVLTRLPWLRDDDRLRQMLAVLRSKVDEEGRFSAESVWTAWKGWEFAQKREPSRWLTLLSHRCIGRVEGA
jgi:hypothetical protein